MIHVLNGFASALLTKFVEQVDIGVVFVLLFVCYALNNYFKWCAESDRAWARWMIDARRKVMMPLAPYLLSFIIFFFFFGHEGMSSAVAGERAWEAILHGTVAVAFYEIWRRVGYRASKAIFGATLTRIKGKRGM